MTEEPYDPWLDYEPPYRPERARRQIDHDYLVCPAFRKLLDKHLESAAATAARWKAEYEQEAEMRFPLPWFCRWMWLEETIQHFEALKAQIKEGSL